MALPSKTLGNFDPLVLTPKKSKITVTGMLRNASGQKDTTSPPTLCATTKDCADQGLASSTCVEGSCRNGVYNFWSIVPRDPSDILTVN